MTKFVLKNNHGGRDEYPTQAAAEASLAVAQKVRPEYVFRIDQE